MSDLEDRLRHALDHVADRVTTEGDWSRVVADVSMPARQPPQPTTRSRWQFAAAAAAVVLVALGLAFRLGVVDDSTTTAVGPGFVLPGETVIGDDPLTVVAAPGPAPQFDTGRLGTELWFDPIDQVDDEVVDLLSGRPPFGRGAESPGKAVKVTLVGRVEGVPWVIRHWNAPNVDRLGGGQPDENLRYREVLSTDGGMTSGEPASEDSPAMIKLPSAENGMKLLPAPSYTAPTGWLFWGPLPAETSVVTFSDSDQRLWIRPRAGLAVFPVQFDDREVFTIEALDAAGNVIGRLSDSVGYGDDAERTGPQVGHRLGALAGTDASGERVSIEPDGTDKVFLFGADWCQPCSQLVDDEMLQVIEALAPGSATYAVPLYTDEPWPSDIEWPYSTFIPELTSPLKAVFSLPALLVLDGENEVVAVAYGTDEVLAELSRIGRDLAEGQQLESEAAQLCEELEGRITLAREQVAEAQAVLNALEGQRAAAEEPQDFDPLVSQALSAMAASDQWLADLEEHRDELAC